MIKVSVIVPVYKVPLEYLRACLDSLTAQTMQECEFIIVSDGAPEVERAMCKEYAEKDSRFKIFNRTHSGVSTTRNYGIEQAQGEYLIFVDSDDWINPSTCEATYDFAKKNDSDIVLFDYIPIGNSPYKQASYGGDSVDVLQPAEIEIILKEAISLTDDKFVGAVSTMCKLTKRELFVKNRIQFPENVAIAEDRVVSYSLFLKADCVSYLKKELYVYNIQASSSSNKFDSNILPKTINYLYAIKYVNKEHAQIIANTAVNLYFASWEKCYLNKKNSDSIFKRVKNIFSIAHSNDFQKTIQSANISEYPPIIKQEVWLLKHKIAFPFFFHVIKYYF
jgi:glycosyltransferase involved in cell wall biosynthesis